MKILHTGDLHLDSAFAAFGKREAEDRRQEGRELLCRIFECARSENCQMMLIAGDLFDGRFVSPETAELFCSLVEKNDITVVVSPGNHDFYTENSFYASAQKRLGEKLALFTSPEVQIFDFDELGVRVFGYAFCSASLTSSPLAEFVPPEDNGYIKLFCGHCDINLPLSRYAPVSTAELERLGADYAALGHIHNASELEYLGGRARYCGFAEGRSFDEIGEGGAFIVDVRKDGLVCTRKILSCVNYFVLDVTMPQYENEDELADKLAEAILKNKYPKGTRLRLNVGGNSDGAWQTKSLEEKVCSSAGLDELQITDQTLPMLDGEYLKRDTTIRGELYRTLLPKLMSEDAYERRTAVRALRIGLAAIDGKNIFNS